MIDVIDLLAAVGDGRIWVALLVACASVGLLVPGGVLVARRTGLLETHADRIETFGVGLSIGLVVLTAGWAATASGGRSVFLPVLVAVVLAIGAGSGWSTVRPRFGTRLLRDMAVVAAVLVALGLLYAMTITPSPRAGQQPLEFFDVGFYTVLGADLADTGLESIYSPTGFEATPGLPEQTWYHWGELWLAAAVIDLTGISPIHARHIVVLPILLLAAATLVGALVRRLVTISTEYFVIAASAALFLAPIPLSNEVHFAGWARGLTFSITQYGLAALVVLLGIHLIAVRPSILARRSGRLLAGALGAALIASHIGLAAVAAAAIGGTVVIVAAMSLQRAGLSGARRHLSLSSSACGVLTIVGWALVSIAWGTATGHGLGALEPTRGIEPFEPAWRFSMISATLGAGVLLAPALALTRPGWPTSQFGMLGIGALLAVVGGAFAWGLRVADLNTFHLFFGSISVMLTPIAIIQVLKLLEWARRGGRRRVAIAIWSLVLVQTSVSGVIVLVQLNRFAPDDGAPVAERTLAAIRNLPGTRKMAYSCGVFENVAPWDASLIAIDAHTSVRMIPMCFMADRQRKLLERPLDPKIENPAFILAPQRHLFPRPDSRPTTEMIRRFLVEHGIDYVYADPRHPNTLVPDAEPIYSMESITIYRVDSRGGALESSP